MAQGNAVGFVAHLPKDSQTLHDNEFYGDARHGRRCACTPASGADGTP